ncbi:uncharacterized protein TNCV_2944961 [Trichonephila clavipes]|nr:uncharacterized protein TNCV_2944961 [Trichonephila clavipes]
MKIGSNSGYKTIPSNTDAEIITAVTVNEEMPENDEEVNVEDTVQTSKISQNNMLIKYQMIKFIDFCEVLFLPESVDRVAAIVGDHRCHTPRHRFKETLDVFLGYR